MWKRLTPALLLALGLVVVSAAFAYPALSTPTTPAASVNARLRALESKTRALQAQVKVLQAKGRSHDAELACVTGAVPVTRWGGFIFTRDHGVSVEEQTALDVTDAGEAVSGYVATFNPACLEGAAAQFKLQTLKTAPLERR
jgi:hypothetical protein